MTIKSAENKFHRPTITGGASTKNFYEIKKMTRYTVYNIAGGSRHFSRLQAAIDFAASTWGDPAIHSMRGVRSVLGGEVGLFGESEEEMEHRLATE